MAETQRLLDAERARLAPLMAETEQDASVVAHRVISAVRREDQQAEAQGTRPSAAPRKLRLARWLAWSVVAHAAALAVVLFVQGARQADAPSEGDTHFAAHFEGANDDAGDEAGTLADVAAWLDVAGDTPEAVAALPDELLGGPTSLGWRTTRDELDQDTGAVEALDRVAQALASDLARMRASEGIAARAHPASVAIPMMIRTHPRLRERRMKVLGWDVGSTANQVERVLAVLASRQQDDGSFGADGGDPAETTAWAVLPFLAEGRSSVSDGPRGTVSRAIAYLRQHIAARTTPRAQDWVPAIALAEDYMLAYGALELSDARARRAELRQLAGNLQRAPLAGARLPFEQAWAREALTRTGAVPHLAHWAGQYKRWIDDVAAGLGAQRVGSSLSTASVLQTVTAHVLHTLGRRAPRRTSTTALLQQLRKLDASRKPDQAGSTRELAQALLAWQAPYRAY